MNLVEIACISRKSLQIVLSTTKLDVEEREKEKKKKGKHAHVTLKGTCIIPLFFPSKALSRSSCDTRRQNVPTKSKLRSCCPGQIVAFFLFSSSLLIHWLCALIDTLEREKQKGRDAGMVAYVFCIKQTKKLFPLPTCVLRALLASTEGTK